MKFFKKVRNGDKRIVYFGSSLLLEYSPKKYFKFFPKSDEELLLDKIIKIIGEKYDSVFYLRAGLGEAYIFYFI